MEAEVSLDTADEVEDGGPEEDDAIVAGEVRQLRWQLASCFACVNFGVAMIQGTHNKF